MVQTAIAAEKHDVTVLFEERGIYLFRTEVAELAVGIREETDRDGFSFMIIGGNVLTMDHRSNILDVHFQVACFEPGIDHKTDPDESKYSKSDKKRHAMTS